MADGPELGGPEPGGAYWSSSAARVEASVGETSHVRAVVRVRPMNQKEVDGGHAQIMRCDGQTIAAGGGAGQPREFSFDQALAEDVGQDHFFEAAGVRAMLDAGLQGYSATIFAYGQTGSGKTYTMIGPDDGQIGIGDAGLIPRACAYLLQRASESSVRYTIRTSFLEIYNEQVFDLLNPGPTLSIRWGAGQGFFVVGLLWAQCDTLEDLLAVVAEGVANRRVASHEMNADSSRSHSMLTLELTIEDAGAVRTGRVSLVDLAGSERLKDTKSSDTILKEAGSINQSLFVLGKVISALSSNAEAAQDGRQHGQGYQAQKPPYRDSKLTKLLMESLGGNSLTLMVACVSPSSSSIGESVSTLWYASRAQRIQNRPTQHMEGACEKEGGAALVAGLQAECAHLRCDFRRSVP
jgi:hypothetical protein